MRSFFSVLLITSSLSACVLVDSAAVSQLEGSWVSNCFHLDSGGYSTSRLTFTGGNFTQSTRTYNVTDNTCSSSVIGNEVTNGKFVVGALTGPVPSPTPSANVAPAGNIDYNYLNGLRIFDVYRINGKQLQFGDKSVAVTNGTTSEKRPRVLETNIAFQKVD